MSILILQEFIKEFGVKADKRFLGQAGGRLAAGRGLLQRHNLYACPVGDSLQSPVGVAEPFAKA